MAHESHLLVLQQVKIDNNERELANKVKQEEDIMHQIMRPDESEDGVNQDKLDQNYNTHANTTQIKAHARKHARTRTHFPTFLPSRAPRVCPANWATHSSRQPLAHFLR